MNIIKHKTLNVVVSMAAIAVLATGCSTDPRNVDFETALTTNYKHYANYQTAKEVNWRDQQYFQNKAVDPAKKMQPEQPAAWELLDFDHDETVDARQRLITVLKHPVRDIYPLTAARAQAKFDCWVEKAEEKWESVETQHCRSAFYRALSQLEMAMNNMPMAENLEPMPQPVMDGVDHMHERVHFDHDSSSLTKSALTKVRELMGRLSGKTYEKINLEGHADRSGTESYNMGLSEQRAQAVKKEFVDMGFDPSSISTDAKGEAQPVVPTADGVRNKENRRVEIDVK